MPMTLERLTAFKTVTVAGHDFTIHRMKPLTVIAVARRLAPLLSILKGMRDGAQPTTGADPSGAGAKPATPQVEQNFSDAMDRFGPLLEGLARRPEEDVNFVIGACLGCVQMRGSAHPRVWSTEHNTLSDDSLTPGDVMSLVGQVLFKVFEELMSDLPDIGSMGTAKV
ncbi:phage tail assembly chaperone [Methylobacterium sp. J-068]|uniref:phage tail assembly chaperone n=1 Tax=Methylobacterium sp. J-068 TaxID=2836649 RepID=UPI001FBA990A|nr:hypothetical protein [Methylobacterium sp. J-068]MCJ2036394.1 hypothetical protein [Methylobacterium sp. J-068]